VKFFVVNITGGKRAQEKPSLGAGIQPAENGRDNRAVPTTEKDLIACAVFRSLKNDGPHQTSKQKVPPLIPPLMREICIRGTHCRSEVKEETPVFPGFQQASETHKDIR
jgi:hypothetical protein